MKANVVGLPGFHRIVAAMHRCSKAAERVRMSYADMKRALGLPPGIEEPDHFQDQRSVAKGQESAYVDSTASRTYRPPAATEDLTYMNPARSRQRRR